MKKIMIIVCVLLGLSSNCFAIIPTAKVTLKVIDVEKKPVSNARIDLTFFLPRYTGWGTAARNERIYTDQDGGCTISGRTINGIGIGVFKKGYYNSLGGAKFNKSENYLFFKRWIPWNPTIKIVLREKRNPVKMYSKDTDYMNFPVQNKEVGYDLVKGDWVAPYGKGETNDFILVLSHRYITNDDWDSKYELKFSNKGDGLQTYRFDPYMNSEFKWPYLAPEKGYTLKELKKYKIYFSDGISKTTTKSNIKKDRNYIFRVRTKTDDNGNVISAMYGIMKDDIYVKGTLISFKYKLNPTNRSLEYGGNLFKDED